MKRREFITLLGGAAAWPLAARAQQAALPVVGWLGGRSPEADAPFALAFGKGLAETGYVKGRNVAIESHWAYGQIDRLPALAADLLQRQPFVMFVAGSVDPSIPAIRALNPTVPIVFTMARDPVQAGIVASLNRPTGNITGVTNLGAVVSPKRIELLHELVPQATSIALLGNPIAGDPFPEPDMLAAAQTLGLSLYPLRAGNEREIDDAFAALSKIGAGGLVIEPHPLFTTRAQQLAALALRHRIPAIYQFHEFAAGGGLATFGGNSAEQYRLAGIYVGRILKGEKPADLPVQEVTKIELVINLKTAKALGLTVPITLLGRADEVIE
jgi:putative tryptophan/tyrosine transport system substrate-binding protein